MKTATRLLLFWVSSLPFKVRDVVFGSNRKNIGNQFFFDKTQWAIIKNIKIDTGSTKAWYFFLKQKLDSKNNQRVCVLQFVFKMA